MTKFPSDNNPNCTTESRPKKPVEITPISVTRTSYLIRTRKDGRPAPIAFDADTPREAKELAQEKARNANLPLFHLDHRQKFEDQVDDGVYLCELVTHVGSRLSPPLLAGFFYCHCQSGG